MSAPRVDLSFCWAFADDDPEPALPRLREYGFDGIELWPDNLKKYGATRWAAALTAAGMKCFQLCPYFNFVHGEAKIAESRLILREYLDAARIMGCHRLRVFTGPPWGDGIVGAYTATDAQWADATRSLQEFCDAAPDVELCLECHIGSLMEDSPSALRLIRAVARKNLTTNMQLPLCNEDWGISLKSLTPYTTHIHIHNWTKGLGEGELTFLDEGAFDWKPVVQHLLAHGRSVCLSVEHANHLRGDDPWETARRDGAFLQSFRKSLKRER